MTVKHALAVRSDFSIGESLLSSKKIPAKAKSLGYDSVAVVDTMTISSMIAFAKEAKKENIKSVVGCRIRVVDEPDDKTPPKKRDYPNHEYFVKVYVKNEAGLRSLYSLLTKANSEEYFYYVPRVGLEDLCAALSDGDLAVSTGDLQSVFHHPDYKSHIFQMAIAAGRSQTFVEMLPIHTPLFETLNEKAMEVATDMSLLPLLTRPMFYEGEDDSKTLDVLSVIASKSKMNAPWRNIQQVQDFTFISPPDLLNHAKRMKETMERRLGAGACGLLWQQAAQNMQVLVDLCQYEWSKQDVSLPVMASDESAKLIEEIKKGWKRRLMKSQLGYQPAASELNVYKERLAYELSTLKDMGFERYFLLVQDLTNWSKSNEIMVGPGRGSVGGSLVAYLLGITDVDPIRFGLIFERFINPDRLDLPDADLDFMSSRRGEVINYLVERYGTDRVAGISNFATMASASALRDVARVHELEPMDYSCSKLVPAVHGKSHSLEDASKEVPEIEAFSLSHPRVWKHAVKLQGVMRSLGKHAAGIVVAGEPIVNRAVVEHRKGEPTVNWDKRVVEDQGLVKMDILGLSTLDVLSIAKDKVKQNKGVDVVFDELPLDDPAVLEAFGRGDTVGVFQFESGGMRKLLKDLAQSNSLTFDDIAAATALYRPGPMDSGLMDDFVQVKQGFKIINHEHPNMNAALEQTYGVIVYQEQVMQLARDLAGFTMAGADHLRKAMGKKDRDMMMQQRQKWVDGCKSHSALEEKVSGVLFDKIEAFAGYAFNRSHAVEYSIISYWALWMKINHPAEFYAGSMSILREDKLSGLVDDARSREIYVVPPDVNRSTDTFEVTYDSKREQHVLVTPFNRAKGLSDNTARAIMEGRKKAGGSFKRFVDFFDNVNKTKVNKRAQATLDKIGGFAGLEFGQEEADRHEKHFPHIELRQLEARHPNRLRDQIALMPGLIVDVVKAERKIETDKFIKAKVIDMVQTYRSECDKCTLAGGVHPAPKMGSSPKVMIITDCPTWQEDSRGELMDNKSGLYVKTALKEAGLSMRDCYFTTLVKSIKEGKQLTNEQINGCSPYLHKEIEWLRPPVIIALGSATVRHLVPGVKGGFAELCGQVHYSSDLDASIVFGLNPQMIFHDGDKQLMLNDAFKKVASMVV